jgi:tetratricopeptide (TPR) repeat protein
MNVAELLDKADEAIASQSWQEAWGVLGQVDHAQLGSRESDLLLLAATVRRHQGEIQHAERLYNELRERVSLQDERLADVVMGLAECAHLRGAFQEAGMLAQAARFIPTRDPMLALRLACAEAHIRSHINIDQSIELFELLMRYADAAESSVWANITFQYADALFVAGRIAEALPEFLHAHALATASGATVTTADCLRRIPLTRALLQQDEYALRSVHDFTLAKRLYEVAGDRGAVYLHTEEAEVYRGLRRYREAERTYHQGLWAAREIRDDNRVAHNLLGLFELSRVAGQTLKWRHLEEARELYTGIDNDWGVLHTDIAQLLADRKARSRLRQSALERIAASRFGRFERERAILRQFGDMTPDDIDKYPHLLNYP